MWEQQSVRPIMTAFPSFLLWSPRGKLTNINGSIEVKRLLQGRWREASKEELERYKPGDYFPLYDYGENVKEDQNSDFIQAKAIGEVLDVLEV